MDTIETCLHQFVMGDCEDPYLYAAYPIHKWQQTEHGRWCMQHVVGEPKFFCHADMRSMGYRVAILGNLTAEDLVFFKLKWAKYENNSTRV